MDIWYRRDTGLEYLYSRMQSKETNVKASPLDTEIKGEDPTMPSKGADFYAKWGIISGDINTQHDLMRVISDTKRELEDLIEGKVASVFIYRGQVADMKSLPTGATIGDVYDVAETGSNYVWNGVNWDKLSETVDLSGYVKLENLDLYYLKSEIDAFLKAMQDTEDERHEQQEQHLQLHDKHLQVNDEQHEDMVAEINRKANKKDVDEQIFDVQQKIINVDNNLQDVDKFVQTFNKDVQEALALKADKKDVNEALALKADKKELEDAKKAINVDLNTKVDKLVTSDNGKAKIFNEASGGGAQFDNTKKNTLSYVGVNDGNDGVYVQIYSKDKATNKGARLNASPQGIFYTNGKTNGSYESGDELVTKNDLTQAIEAVDHSTYATKQEVSDGLNVKADKQAVQNDLNKKVDKLVESADGKAKIFNEASGGGAQFDNIKKNTLSYVGVNNGNDGVFVQIYSKDKATNKGSRLNAAPEGIFYTSGKTNASYEPGDEIVTKNDLTKAIEAVDHTTYATKEQVAKDLKKKVDTLVESDNGKAKIFNESSGGGAQFDNTKKNTLSYVGVNDGNDGVFVQIYSKDKATNKGARINAAPTGIYYTNGKTNGSYEAKDEIATKGDLETAISAVDHTMYATNDALAEGLAKKVDATITGKDGKAKIFNETSGGGAQFDNTTKNTLSYVGVNDGNDGIFVQIYSKDKKTNKGARLNASPDGIFYTNGKTNGSFTEQDELVTKADLDGVVTNSNDLFATKEQVDINKQETDTAINEINETLATKADLKDAVLYTDYTHNGEERRTVRLDNYDSISGNDTKGNMQNLIMLSKWDVVDVGDPQIHTNLNTSMAVTVNNDEIVVTDEILGKALLPSEHIEITKHEQPEPTTGFMFNTYEITTKGLATEEALTQVDNRVIEVNKQVVDTLSTQDGNIQTLLLKIQELEKKIVDVKSLDPEIVVLYDGSDANYENKEKDFHLSGTVVTPTTVKGNSITLKDTALNAATMSLVAAQDVTIANTNLTGLIPKKISSSLFQIHADGYVAVRDCKLTPESAYNGVDVGLTYGLAKSVTIDNVDFDGHFVNNAISVYAMANNGVITISNCHFADVSNVLRLSNRTNCKYTVNLINCTFDKWATGEYAGMILLQDYTSTSADQANTDNQFAKININIQNCIGPNGKITPVDLSTVCGTKLDTQLIYMWDNYRKHTAYGNKYPNITIL